MLIKTKSAITAGVLTTAFAVGSFIFSASPSVAQVDCRRVLNERCSQTFRVDAGKASHTSQGKKVEINEVTVPSGYVVVNFREIDDSGNSGGGTFNVDYAARGTVSETVRQYASESSRISNYKAKVDALYQSSQGSEKAKLDILRNQLNELSSASSTASSVDTNTDVFTLRATSQYQCTRMVFGECLDGKGGHGKGRVVVDLIYVGDNPSAKLNRIEQQIASLEDSTQTNSGSTGFYRQSNRPEVYLVYRPGFYCHVQNENQMQAYGGFEKVNVVDNLNLTGTETGDCGWPNGFYRRSNQPEVYRMYGNENQAFNIGSGFCHVVDEAQMDRFGGLEQVQVVSPSSDLGRGRNFAGECSNP